MKQGWEIKNFEEVCELIGGSQPAKDDFIYEPKAGYIRLIQVRDYRSDKFITYIPKVKARRFCNKEDIMIGRYGPPIFGIFKGLEGAYNVALMKANVNENICDKNYFFLFLKTNALREFVEHSSKRAAGQDGVRKELLDKYPVPLPPLPEQRRIVSILDEAFTAIAKAKVNAEQNLKNAKELFESYLQGVFENIKSNGQLYLLANYLDLITYGFTNPMPTTSEGPYMVTAKNVKGGIVDYGTARRTSQYAFDSLITDKCRPVKGDVLLTKDGTLGRLAVVEKPNLCINQSVALLRPNKQLDSYYLKELLSSQFYQRLMIEQAGGATIKHIYITRVDKMMVPIPTLLEQQAIVKKLDILSNETKKLETIYQSKINDLEELKKSVLQKAFSGELKTAEQCA